MDTARAVDDAPLHPRTAIQRRGVHHGGDLALEALRQIAKGPVRFTRVGSGIANDARIICGTTGAILGTFVGANGDGWCDVDCMVAGAELRFYVEAWGGGFTPGSETPHDP